MKNPLFERDLEQAVVAITRKHPETWTTEAQEYCRPDDTSAPEEARLGALLARLETERATRLVAGRYHKRQRLGEGSFAEVWLAHDFTLNCSVALKLFKTRDRLAQDRILEEATLFRKVRSNHVVTLYDVGRTQGEAQELFLVLELVGSEATPGRTLSGMGPSRDPASPLQTIRQAVEWTIQICRGVRGAHVHQVAHRDIKPANILIDLTQTPPQLKVADFGVAKLLGGYQEDRATMVAATSRVFRGVILGLSG